jgi:hypothetical protein
MYKGGETIARPFPDVRPVLVFAYSKFWCSVLLIVLFEKRLNLRCCKALHEQFTSSYTVSHLCSTPICATGLASSTQNQIHHGVGVIKEISVVAMILDVTYK